MPNEIKMPTKGVENSNVLKGGIDADQGIEVGEGPNTNVLEKKVCEALKPNSAEIGAGELKGPPKWNQGTEGGRPENDSEEVVTNVLEKEVCEALKPDSAEFGAGELKETPKRNQGTIEGRPEDDSAEIVIDQRIKDKEKTIPSKGKRTNQTGGLENLNMTSKITMKTLLSRTSAPLITETAVQMTDYGAYEPVAFNQHQQAGIIPLREEDHQLGEHILEEEETDKKQSDYYYYGLQFQPDQTMPKKLKKPKSFLKESLKLSTWILSHLLFAAVMTTIALRYSREEEMANCVHRIVSYNCTEESVQIMDEQGQEENSTLVCAYWRNEEPGLLREPSKEQLQRAKQEELEWRCLAEEEDVKLHKIPEALSWKHMITVIANLDQDEARIRLRKCREKIEDEISIKKLKALTELLLQRQTTTMTTPTPLKVTSKTSSNTLTRPQKDIVLRCALREMHPDRDLEPFFRAREQERLTLNRTEKVSKQKRRTEPKIRMKELQKRKIIRCLPAFLGLFRPLCIGNNSRMVPGVAKTHEDNFDGFADYDIFTGTKGLRPPMGLT